MSRASLKNWPRNHSSRRSPVPDVLKQLSYDDYRDIRFDSEQSLWKETGSNFQVHCLTERQREKWRPKGFVRAATDPYANLVHVGLLAWENTWVRRSPITKQELAGKNA
jgi:hypothetical protein